VEQSLAVHLLSRVAFGPRPGEAEQVAAMGAEAYLSEQLEAPTEPARWLRGGGDQLLRARSDPVPRLRAPSLP